MNKIVKYAFNLVIACIISVAFITIALLFKQEIFKFDSCFPIVTIIVILTTFFVVAIATMVYIFCLFSKEKNDKVTNMIPIIMSKEEYGMFTFKKGKKYILKIEKKTNTVNNSSVPNGINGKTYTFEVDVIVNEEKKNFNW